MILYLVSNILLLPFSIFLSHLLSPREQYWRTEVAADIFDLFQTLFLEIWQNVWVCGNFCRSNFLITLLLDYQYFKGICFVSGNLKNFYIFPEKHPFSSAMLNFPRNTISGVLWVQLFALQIRNTQTHTLSLEVTNKEWNSRASFLGQPGNCLDDVKASVFVSPIFMRWTLHFISFTGLAKNFVWVFCTMLWKNPNEYFGQPNT